VPFVCNVAEKGSEILTDGWGGYNKLSKHGYKHEKVFLNGFLIKMDFKPFPGKSF